MLQPNRKIESPKNTEMKRQDIVIESEKRELTNNTGVWSMQKGYLTGNQLFFFQFGDLIKQNTGPFPLCEHGLA